MAKSQNEKWPFTALFDVALYKNMIKILQIFTFKAREIRVAMNLLTESLEGHDKDEKKEKMKSTNSIQECWLERSVICTHLVAVKNVEIPRRKCLVRSQ